MTAAASASRTASQANAPVMTAFDALLADATGATPAQYTVAAPERESKSQTLNPTGDGTPVAALTLTNLAVVPGSLVIVDDQASPVTWTDQGDGTLTPSSGGTVAGVSATVSYTTGAVSLTYGGNVTLAAAVCTYQRYVMPPGAVAYLKSLGYAVSTDRNTTTEMVHYVVSWEKP